MEGKNMATPEGTRQGVFPVTRTEERTRVLPRPKTEPVPVVPEPRKRPEKRSLIRRMVNNLAFRIFLATGTIAGTGYAVYREIPAVHETVDQQVLARFGLTEAETVVPPTFDNKAISGVVTPSMIEKVPQGEIDRLFPTPFGKIENRNTVQVLYPLDVSTSKNPDVKIKYKISNSSDGNEQDRIKRAEEGFLNLFEVDNVPPGTIIRAPVDGLLRVYTNSETLPVNDHDYGGATIVFKTVDGRNFNLMIGGGTKKNRADVFRSLTNAPVIGSKISREEEKESKPIPIKRGDPILQVAGSEVMIGFTVSSLDYPDISQGKEIILPNGEKAILLPPPPPTNVEFFLTPEGKLITSQE